MLQNILKIKQKKVVRQMKADEMFEELGYKVKHQIFNDEVILIGYTREDNIAEECSVMFLKKS